MINFFSYADLRGRHNVFCAKLSLASCCGARNAANKRLSVQQLPEIGI
jgi:hypothetical protein